MAHNDHSEFREDFSDQHPHEYDHSEPQFSVIAILGGVTVVLLIIVGIGIQQYYDRTEESLVYRTVTNQPDWLLQDLRNKENWELSHYGHYDKTKGTMRLPIDQAMKLVAEEAASNTEKYPTVAYAVKTAAQLAAAGQTPQPGAAAGQATRQPGVTSSPNVQNPSVPTPSHK